MVTQGWDWDPNLGEDHRGKFAFMNETITSGYYLQYFLGLIVVKLELMRDQLHRLSSHLRCKIGREPCDNEKATTKHCTCGLCSVVVQDETVIVDGYLSASPLSEDLVSSRRTTYYRDECAPMATHYDRNQRGSM
ncbi:2308_t:CDS:2 [Gigaspora rosea]|nr:2308_t:CDS:2 [Gigaspora rosea]